MPRDLTPAMEASLEKSSGVDVVWLILAEFSGGTVRLCTASDDIEWSGETWEGVGGSVRPGPITEDPDPESQGLSITLPAVDQILVQKLLTEHFIGRTVQIWKAHLDPDTGLIVEDPIDGFTGEMLDDFTITHDTLAGTSLIKGRAVSRVGRGGVIPILRMNRVSHGRFYPGDLFYQYVGVLAAKQLFWAGKSTKPLRDRPPPDYPGDERGQYPNG